MKIATDSGRHTLGFQLDNPTPSMTVNIQPIAPMNMIRKFICLAFLVLLPLPAILVAEEPGIAEKTSETVSVAAKTTTETVGSAWDKINENRLVNRSPEEIVAWLFIGMLVGSVAGMATKLKPTGLGKLARLGLGLAGALIGGMVVRVAEISFGWRVIQIHLEELLFSLVGAVLLVFIGRFFLKRTSQGGKKPN